MSEALSYSQGLGSVYKETMEIGWNRKKGNPGKVRKQDLGKAKLHPGLVQSVERLGSESFLRLLVRLHGFLLFGGCY
jgi:hypothetical protein